MTTFDYRRRLERDELAMLAGAAAGAGAALATAVFYLGRIWLQRVPLKPERGKDAGTGTDAARGPGPDPALRALADAAVRKQHEGR